MAQSSRGIIEVTSAAGLNDLVSGDEVVLVYFSFGAKSAANPDSLGDEFDPQFEEFAESGEVVPKLFRASHSATTAQFFMDVDIDPVLGGSLVLWKRGAVLAKTSVKDLNQSSDVETEVVKWLAGKYPSQDGSAKARPARPSSAMAQVAGPPPGPKTAVPGQTPGAMCGAPPAGPPPGPRPGQPTTMTVGAALSGPPPGPKTAVPVSGPNAPETASPPTPAPPPKPQLSKDEVDPIHHPETPCPVPPQTPSQPAPTPPADLKARTSPASVAKQEPMTALVQSSPPPSEDKDAELAKSVPPTRKPVEKVQKELSPTADPTGQRVSKAAPELPKIYVPLTDPPADDLGERIAKLFASHSRNGAVSRETMKALLKFLLTKQGSRKDLGPAHVDRIVDKFIEESDSGSSVDASQFIRWVWSGAKSRK